ncbi:MAG: hypothetical protein AAF989_03345 [Planctomycetota bacterium]
MIAAFAGESTPASALLSKDKIAMKKRNSCALLATVLLFSTGCGSSSDPETAAVSGGQTAVPTQNTAQTPISPAQIQANRDASMQVVAEFLDQVRRGGDQNRADQLLTNEARTQIAKVGGVQNLGAPDAQFTVTRSEPVPDDEGGISPDSMFVHSVWAEPAPAGAVASNPPLAVDETQVVWAVQKEGSNWRISGMVVANSAGEAPTIIDFENGVQMAQLFGQLAPPSAEGTDSRGAAPAMNR